MTEICVYCGTETPGGYCFQSPNGQCLMDDAGPDYVSPYDCCHECGTELTQGELQGFQDHICDPERVKAYKAFLESPDDDSEWDYRS
jgi:hypothetical protein